MRFYEGSWPSVTRMKMMMWGGDCCGRGGSASAARCASDGCHD